MAFTDDEGSGGRFVKIIDGSLCEKAPFEKNGVELPPPNEKYKLFKTKNPETDAEVQYYLRRYKNISGMVESLERVEIPASKIYGYNLHMSDEDGNFSIFFKDDAKVTDRLLKVFENFDLNEEVTLSVWKDENGRPAIAFYQDEKSVSPKWTGFVDKESGTWKGNLPEPKMSKGKWNYDPISEFLYENTMKNIIPQFVGKEEESTEAPQYTGVDEDDASTTASTGKKSKTAKAGADKDDIPF